MAKVDMTEAAAVKDLRGIYKKDNPLLVIVVDTAKYYGAASPPFEFENELRRLVEGLSHLPIHFRVLLVGKTAKSKHIMKNTYEIEQDHIEQFFTFAHMVLFLSEHPSKALVKRAVSQSAVPIAHASVPFLKNYEAPSENGNAFTFADFSSWSMYTAIVRALENYNFPYDWKNIIRDAKQSLG